VESKYRKYDQIIQVIMTNIEVERGRNGKYLLYDFQPELPMDKLYYNATAIMADLNHEPIYIDLPFFDFMKFRHERRKRKNLKWFGPLKKRKLSDDCKISAHIIMDLIREVMELDESIFEEINSEYYGDFK